MTAINQNFTQHLGDTKLLVLTVRDDDGVLINLSTVSSARFVIKQYENSTDILVSKTLGSGIAVTSAIGGVLTVTVASSDTSALNSGEYYHETRIVTDSAVTSTIATGSVILKPSTSIS